MGLFKLITLEHCENELDVCLFCPFCLSIMLIVTDCSSKNKKNSLRFLHTAYCGLYCANVKVDQRMKVQGVQKENQQGVFRAPGCFVEA